MFHKIVSKLISDFIMSVMSSLFDLDKLTKIESFTMIYILHLK